MKKPLPWYQNFQVVAYVVAGLTALGTVIVVTNKYIVLPERVEAAEQEIDDLKDWAKEIQGYTRAMTQQQMPTEGRNLPRQNDPKEYFRDPATGIVWCCDPTQYDCRVDELWDKCERWME